MELLSQNFFGNTVLEYLVSLAVFFGVYIGLSILKSVSIHRLQAIFRRTAFDFDDVICEVFQTHVGPLVFFFTALYFAIHSLTLPVNVTKILSILFVVVLTVKLIQAGQVVLTYLATRWLQRTQPETPVAASIVTGLIKIGLWAGGLLFVFDNLGIDVTAFIAGLGIGGVAVALAAQAILGDAFSSFAIFMDKPFELGDFIIVGDLMGTVEHIGFKTTRIRSLGGEQLVFANSDLTSSRIRNYKRMEQRRVVFKVGVIYQTPTEQLKAIPGMIRQIIEEDDRTRFDRAHFQSYGDFALTFEVVYYVLSADYNIYMDIQHAINVRIKEEFEQAGIEFAYPTQQLYITKAGLEAQSKEGANGIEEPEGRGGRRNCRGDREPT